MIPVLFKEDEQVFTHNGIGALYESLSCDVIEEENGAFTMELEYPVDGEWFSEIKDFRIIQAKPNDIDEPHNFRIYEIEKSIDELTVFVRANTRTNDLGNNLITNYVGRDVTPQQAMNGIKNSLIEPTNFDLISDIQTRSSVEWTRINPLNAIVGTRGSLVDIWGGQLKRTNTAIHLYSRRGRDNVVTIRPGKNIEGLNMTVSTAGLVTKILPTFSYRPVDVPKYQMVTLSDGTKEKRRVQASGSTTLRDDNTVLGNVVSSQYVDNYPTNYWASVDYGDDEQLKNTVDNYIDSRLTHAEESSGIVDMSGFDQELESFVKTELDKRAKQYFTHRNPGVDKPTVRITVNMLQLSDSPDWEEFKDLERIGLTDTLDVWVEEYDIDVEVRVTSLTYESIAEEVTSFNAGSDRAPRQSAIEKKYDDLTKATNDYVTSFKNGVQNILRNTADGLNRKFEGYTEPPAELSSEGDIWFKEIGEGKVEIWIHDGVYWQPLMTEDFANQIQAEVDEATEAANKAVDEINNAIEAAGFTSLEETVLDIQTISNTAKDNAASAISQAVDALNQASTAIASAETSIGIANTASDNASAALNSAQQSIDAANNAKTIATNAETYANDAKTIATNAKTYADNALSYANDAKTIATEASDTAVQTRDLANNLSSQVSDFDLTVDGFTQTVNDMEGTVSGFRNDVTGFQTIVAGYEIELDEYGNEVSTYATQVSEFTNTVVGLNSTVASYEVELDEYGSVVGTYATQVSQFENTVEGFTSTVAGYRTEVLGYEGEVTLYKNQVSTLNNTVDGFNSTVATYTTQLDEYGNEVDSYATELSTMRNTVDGFESTVATYGQAVNSLTGEVSTYASQVSEFTNTVNGLNSTVASYEVELDEYGNIVDTYATQVSEFENTVDGLSSTVAGYKTEVQGYSDDVVLYTNQVSSMQNTVDGFNSTVVNYTTEVDEFGNEVASYTTEVSTLTNTVNGLNSTVAEYETELIGYRGDVTQYKNQVSTMTNTVNGFNSTVVNYTTEVDEFGNEVNSYATQVSTLENTVSGFNSTVTQVQYDLDNLEIGGRNLVIRHNNTVNTWLLGNGSNPGTTLVTYPNPDSQGALGHSTMLEAIPVIEGEKLTFTKSGLGTWRNNWLDEEYEFLSRFVSTSNEFTETVPAGAHYLWVSYPTLEDVQIERGNKATDWTPAPEDTATVTQVSILENTIDGFRSQVSSIEEDYDGVAGQVATHTSEISNINGQISLKANTTTVNALTGRVSTAESSITTNANAIKLKASQSSVDTLSGKVTTLGAQIDVTAGQISSKVWMTDIDDIEIGGRNLLRGSSDFNRPMWEKVDSVTTSSLDSRYQMVEVRGDFFTSAPNTMMDTQQGWNFEIGQIYTVSVWARTDVSGSRLGETGGEEIVNNNPQAIASEWKRYFWTYEAKTNSLVRFRFETQGASYPVWITQPQIEKGNKATDWTPAPEDTTSLISHVESELTQKHDSITATVSSIDGRVATQKTTLDSISSTVSGHGGRLTTVEQTASGLQTTVASKASQTQFTQLADSFSSVVGGNLLIREDERLDVWIGTNGQIEGANSSQYKSALSRRLIGVMPGERIRFTKWESAAPDGGAFRYRYLNFVKNENAVVRRANLSNSFLDVVPDNVYYLEVSYPYDSDPQIRKEYQSQITQNANNINLRVSKGDVMSQINVEAGRTLIESKKIVLNADTTIIRGTTWMDGAVIKDATIASAKITALDVAKLSGNKSNFVSTAWNSAAGGNTTITGSGILSTDNTNSQTYIQNGVIGFRTSAGHGLGYIGVSQSGDRTNWNQDVSNGSNWLLRYRYTGGFNTVFEYVSYRDRLQAGVTLSMTENDIIGVDNVYSNYFRFSGGGYLRTNSTNSAVEIKSITSMSLQTGSGQAFRLDNTHGYMFRTLSMEGNNITNQSDARLKFNFKEITMDVLAEFKSMEFLEFDRTNGLHDDIGLIAQNTPSLSLYDEENDIWSINSSKQIMMNSLGIQRLAIMEENTNKIASQALQLGETNEEKIKRLEKRIEELESATQ